MRKLQPAREKGAVVSRNDSPAVKTQRESGVTWGSSFGGSQGSNVARKRQATTFETGRLQITKRNF